MRTRPLPSVRTGVDRYPPCSALRLAPAACLVSALCLLAASPAGAGSIFMKNGYIIQGPIVEHSEGADGRIVMGWQNGKVTIYKRFIERVDFEPGEEKNAKIVEAAAVAIPEEIIVTPAVEDELPQTLSEMVKIVNLPQSLIDGPVNLPQTSGEGGAGKDHGTEAGSWGGESTEVSVVPNPVDGQAENPPADETQGTVASPTPRVSEPRWGFSLEPPTGWKQEEIQGCVSWSGAAGVEGFAPSLNVASISVGALSWDEACAALREDQAAAFKDYQFVAEEKLDLGGRPAYRITGRGLHSRGESSTPVAVRQAIVERGGKLWLISTFSTTDAPEDLAVLLDRTVHSLQFDG
jgi:hypothetical protein